MLKYLLAALLVAAALVLAACDAFALEESAAPPAGEGAGVGAMGEVATAPEAVLEETAPDEPEASLAAETTTLSATLGLPVQDVEGKLLGTVRDAVLDLTTGSTVYVLLSFEEFAAESDRAVPVPFSLVRLEPDVATLVVDLEEQQVVYDAPVFDMSDPTTMQDPAVIESWGRSTYDYWLNAGLPNAGTGTMWGATATTPGVQPFAEFGPGARVLPGALMLASQLLGHPIAALPVPADAAASAAVTETAQPAEAAVPQPVGSVQDAIFDRVSGEVRYLVAQFDQAGEGGNLVVMPLGALSWNTAAGTLLFDLAPDALANAPRFDAQSLADLNLADPAWDADLRAYWEQADLAVTLRSGVRYLPGRALRASELLGRTVYGSGGENFGSLSDLIFDPASGRVTYAVIESGVLDADLRLVPVNALALDLNSPSAILGVDQSTLDAAPALPVDSLGAFADPAWDQSFREFWAAWLGPDVQAESLAPGGEQEAIGGGALLVSALLGAPVTNDAGEEVGSVADLMVNLTQGRAAYAVLAVGGFIGIGEKYFAVPLDLLRTGQAEDGALTVLFNVDAAQLEQAPGFEGDAWPNLGDPHWDDDLRAYWQQFRGGE